MFEPAVSAVINSVTQGCMATPADPVTFKVGWLRKGPTVLLAAAPACSPHALRPPCCHGGCTRRRCRRHQGSHGWLRRAPLAGPSTPRRRLPAPLPLQVNVSYTGAKGNGNTPIVSPKECVPSSGSFNDVGSGSIVYTCKFASGFDANGTALNFTSVGLIPGAAARHACFAY
jgi:hypothetical protein